MVAVAHNPSFAKKVGIPTKVGKEFERADKRMADGGNVNAAGNQFVSQPKKVAQKTAKYRF